MHSPEDPKNPATAPRIPSARAKRMTKLGRHTDRQAVTPPAKNPPGRSRSAIKIKVKRAQRNKAKGSRRNEGGISISATVFNSRKVQGSPAIALTTRDVLTNERPDDAVGWSYKNTGRLTWQHFAALGTQSIDQLKAPESSHPSFKQCDTENQMCGSKVHINPKMIWCEIQNLLVHTHASVLLDMHVHVRSFLCLGM